MSDIDLNAIAAQRQGIDSRRRPASDFQMTVTDRHGNERTVWNPKVGGEAAYKTQNDAVDKALSDFDNGPLGSLLKTGAQAGVTAQAQNQAQIDYHKTGLGQATYAGKEAAPWLLGLPLGAAETYGVRKAIGLGAGSPPSARGGAVLGGLGISGLEALLAHQAGEHGKDPTLTPFMHDVNEGLQNAGNAAALSNAVGSVISPFIGTGKPSTASTLADVKPQIEAIMKNSAGPTPPPLSPEAQKAVDFAKKMGAPDTALASHEGASSWLKSEYDRGLTNAQEDLVRQARNDFGMAKNASYGAVLRKFAPAAAVSAGLVSAFAPDTAHAATQAASDLYHNYMPPLAQRAISTVSNIPEFGMQRGEMANNPPPAIAAQDGAYWAAQAQARSAQEESRYRRIVEALQSQAPDNMYGVRRYLGQGNQ